MSMKMMVRQDSRYEGLIGNEEMDAVDRLFVLVSYDGIA